MLWTDLEPGDVLRWTDEAKDKFKNSSNWWMKYVNEDLKITKIELDYQYKDGNMLITFR